MTLLTVLTQKVHRWPGRILNDVRRTVKSRRLRGKRISVKEYGGHPAVTRSLLAGLQRLNANFNYNPCKLDNVGDVVVVLSNVEALRQAIVWKKKNRISKLLAGPNLMVFSDEHNGILGSREIDFCVVPSDWVATAYEEDMPSLKGRIRVWWAGIDEAFWSEPAERTNTDRSVAIYAKNCPDNLTKMVEATVRRYGWSPGLITYGRYSSEEYRKILSEARFAIFLSQSESQGIALSEAWAMNVPTLVWNPGVLNLLGRTYSVVSACPYLTAETGREWTTMTELEQLLRNIDEVVSDCTPRAWVLKHMTDLHSAKVMLGIAGITSDEN